MGDISDSVAMMAAIERDLAASGLTLDDIGGRPLGEAERQTTGTPSRINGYVIPYYDIQGKVIKFYRVRLMDYNPKYRQMANEGNHIYFPPGFLKALNQSNCVLLVEGEKKAACAVKHGYAAVAVSGVDSWRNRTINLPKDTELATGKDGNLIGKLPPGADVGEKVNSLATGFFDLINLVNRFQKPIVILFDTEKGGYQKYEVQTAAALLGHELRYRGVPMDLIKSMKLTAPSNSSLNKVGLDDFIMSKEKLHGLHEFDRQLDETLSKVSAFPLHPNIREHLNKKLQAGKQDRKTMQVLSTCVLSDLDAKGVRLASPDDGELYYFDRINKELTKVSFNLDTSYAKSPFGIKLYKDYNISSADFKLMQWLTTQYSGEEPLVKVRPKKILTLKEDQLYYQLSGSEMIRVTALDIKFLDNGNHDILFESNSVLPVDIPKLKQEIAKWQKEIKEVEIPGSGGSKRKVLPHIWYDVIKETRIKDSPHDYDKKIISLLYNISPWFYRWRETQLPAEMTVGEQGSGKSTLYVLRLNILNGIPSLKNSPSDIKDWGSSVSSVSGLHVTDNVHMLNSTLRQELSDEMCRLITEPTPAIEKRKLYSDFELIKVPVECVFAITALSQPFNNADMIARSIIVEMDKGEEETEFDTGWGQRQLEKFGGREGWLAHQFVFQQLMFQAIAKEWKKDYRAKYRLINVEQLLRMAARIFDMDDSWIPGYLDKTTKVRTSAGDETLAGLRQYAIEEGNGRLFSSKDIADWAKGEDDFRTRVVLTNSRKLGHYITKNSNKVASTTGIVLHDMRANAARYKVDISKLSMMLEAEKEITGRMPHE